MLVIKNSTDSIEKALMDFMIHLLLVVLGFAIPAHAADSSCPKLNRTILIDVGDCTRPGMRLPKVLSNPQRARVFPNPVNTL